MLFIFRLFLFVLFLSTKLYSMEFGFIDLDSPLRKTYLDEIKTFNVQQEERYAEQTKQEEGNIEEKQEEISVESPLITAMSNETLSTTQLKAFKSNNYDVIHKSNVPSLKYLTAASLIESKKGLPFELPHEINAYLALIKLSQRAKGILSKKFICRGKISRNLLNAEYESLKKHGFNPIFVALQSIETDFDSFYALVNHGCNVNLKDGYGCTPLITAVNLGSDVAVDILLSRPDLDVNGEDDFGYTALTHASQKGFGSIVSQLLEHKDIELSHADKANRLPLRHAYEENNDEAFALLMQKYTQSIAHNVQNKMTYELIVKQD